MLLEFLGYNTHSIGSIPIHAFFLGASVLPVLFLIGCLACIRPIKDYIENTMESALPLSEPIIFCGSLLFYGTLLDILCWFGLIDLTFVVMMLFAGAIISAVVLKILLSPFEYFFPMETS